MSSKRAKMKTTKKNPQRATSNVFATFDQSQIQEFKEAFNMIDQNRDGFTDKEDLHNMLASLGNVPFLFTVVKQVSTDKRSEGKKERGKCRACFYFIRF
uniref:Myosin light chain 12B n=1 Tax=Apteryx owenii TaxID=8824 RepID=A0A8B9NXI2_APTOW